MEFSSDEVEKLLNVYSAFAGCVDNYELSKIMGDPEEGLKEIQKKAIMAYKQYAQIAPERLIQWERDMKIFERLGLGHITRETLDDVLG